MRSDAPRHAVAWTIVTTSPGAALHSIGVALALNLRPVKLLVWPCRSEAFRALSLQTGQVSNLRAFRSADSSIA